MVKIMAGKDKGKTGKVAKVIPAEEKIIVEGMNIRTKRPCRPNLGAFLRFQRHDNLFLLRQDDENRIQIGRREENKSLQKMRRSCVN